MSKPKRSRGVDPVFLAKGSLRLESWGRVVVSPWQVAMVATSQPLACLYANREIQQYVGWCLQCP